MAYHDIQDVIWTPPSSAHFMTFEDYTTGPYMRSKRCCEDVVILYEHCIRDWNINSLFRKTFISSHHDSPKQCNVLLPSLPKASLKTNKSLYQPLLTQDSTLCDTCVKSMNEKMSNLLFDFGRSDTFVPFANSTTQLLKHLKSNSKQKISMNLKRNFKKKITKKCGKKKTPKNFLTEKHTLQTKSEKSCQSLCTSPYSDVVIYIDDDSTSTSEKTPTCNISVAPV